MVDIAQCGKHKQATHYSLEALEQCGLISDKRFDEENTRRARVLVKEHTWKVCDLTKRDAIRSIFPSKIN